MTCEHDKTFTLYRRGPKANGSPFIPHADECRSCGLVIVRQAGEEPNRWPCNNCGKPRERARLPLCKSCVERETEQEVKS